MSVNDTGGKVRPRIFVQAWIRWVITATVMVFAFGIVLCRTGSNIQTLAYICSGISFLSAATVGAYLSRNCAYAPLWTGLSGGIISALLLIGVGFMISCRRINSDAVISVAAFTVSGSVTGAVLFGNSKKRKQLRFWKPKMRHKS